MTKSLKIKSIFKNHYENFVKKSLHYFENMKVKNGKT